MHLSAENYYSDAANWEYLSVSQYKDFMGSLGRPACEAQAIAKLRGEWEMAQTTSLLVGSYVDAHFEGTLDLFKAKHPEIFTKSGDLKAEYRKANEIINRFERDSLLMDAMSGEKQVIFTGEIGGAKWKCKLDSYLPGKAIVDLKVMKSLSDHFWVHDMGDLDFVTYWGYDMQAAVYQELVRQNTGVQLPFYIAAISKEPEPDIVLAGFTQQELDDRLSEINSNVPKILALKKGEIEAIRCEHCDYCRHTKVLREPVHHSELVNAI